MGIDFSAIMEYPKFDDRILDVISRLESSQLLEEFDALHKLAIKKKQYDHVFGTDWHWQTERVEDSNRIVTRQSERPELPSSDWSLETCVGFKFTFGPKLATVYHPLRWRIFVEDQEWQHEMLDSLRRITDWFSVTGCVLSHDCTAVVTWTDDSSLESAIKKSVEDWGAFEASTLLETVRELPHTEGQDPDEKNYDSNGYWRFI